MASANSKQWILLAAGSRGWDNYRHQANVCHAYQMAKRNGIPDEQIIVMMYDDIAYNRENPFKGNIINVPDGPNVYSGIQKDYTGDHVSAENFLAVLRGDATTVTKTNAKVLNSGIKDVIFVYLTDHGNSGIFAFPKSTLYASDLIDTVEDMSRKKQFSKMVIYIESCLSGSMLNQLPADINVYGVSASTPAESSYACFYSNSRNVYLSDVFSAEWMFNNETSDLEHTTLQDEYDFFWRNIRNSRPCQYGNKEISHEKISMFWRNSPPESRRQAQACEFTDAVPSCEVPLIIQENRMRNECDPQKKEELKKRYDSIKLTRAKIERAVQEIALCSCSGRGPGCLTERKSPTRLNDLKNVAEYFRTTCFNWHEEEFEYALSQMYVFANLCESGVEVASIKEAIMKVRGTICE